MIDRLIDWLGRI